jgi:ubiquinone biosynthesis monooxygenase Coq7
MNERRYSLMDRMIIGLDEGLATLWQAPVTSNRPSPATVVDEIPLTAQEQRLVEGLMRVNHSGEVSAQALYQGQSLTARDAAIAESMKQSAVEEVDHLVWCEQRILELGGHTSYLNPVWYAGSLLFGAVAGVCGDRWSLGFITETERQVVRHLQGHLERLPVNDRKSRAILEQMKLDESHHATVALEAGAAELPGLVKRFMRLTSRLMTWSSYRL